MRAFLVGAEGFSEDEGRGWLLEARADEVDALKAEVGGEVPYRRLLSDRTGRPYFPVVLAPEAPEKVHRRVAGILRTVRIES